MKHKKERITPVARKINSSDRASTNMIMFYDDKTIQKLIFCDKTWENWVLVCWCKCKYCKLEFCHLSNKIYYYIRT